MIRRRQKHSDRRLPSAIKPTEAVYHWEIGHMRNAIPGIKLVVGAAALVGLLGISTPTAKADDASPPNTTATRPAKEPTGQSSLPSAAPPATTTQTTGAANQDPTTKRMNEEEKKKIETEGK
jgi:hypothetical protein